MPPGSAAPEPAFVWWLLAAPAFAVVGGYIANFSLRAWQYWQDHWQSQVDAFCEAVAEQATTASTYWCEAGKMIETDRQREGSIIGKQVLLDGMQSIFIDVFCDDDKKNVIRRHAEFRDATTAGAFQSANVQPDFQRARECEMTASELLVAVRMSHTHSTKPSAIFSRLGRQILPPRQHSRGEEV